MSVELATAYVTLLPSGKGFAAKTKQELGGLGAAGGNAGGQAASGFRSKFTSGTSGLGAKVGKGVALGFGGAFAGALAIGGIVAVGNELLTAGAQVEQFRKKSDVVFEGQSKAVQKWADANAASFGVTDDQLTGMAASFGDLLKPMGFTSGEAAKMSQEVVGLSGALSSWSGGTVSAADASDVLAKAMLGETDGLKALGIAISQDEINSKLAAEGKDKLTGAALAQAKAIATQELIFAKSTDAQKAWAAGGNKALNSQNKLKSMIGEVKETLAEKLTPALTVAATWIGTNAPKAVALLQRGFKAVQPTLQTAAAWLREKIPPALVALRAGFAVVVSWVRANWPKISAAISSAAGTIRSVITAVVTVVTALWRTFGNNILTFVRSAWGPIQLIIKGAMNIIQGVIKTVTSLISGDWKGAWEGVKQIFRGVWQQIQGVVRQALNIIKLILTSAFEVIRGIVQRAWAGIKALISGALNAIRSGVSSQFNAIKSVISSVLNAARSVVSSIWNGIKSTISSAIGGIRSAASSGFAAVKGFITRPIEQAKSTVSSLLDGIKRLFSDLPGKITSTLSGLASAVAAPFKAMGQAIKDAWNSTIGGKGVTVPDIPGLPGRGQRFEIPRLHSGGEVTGPPGSEQLRILQAGEWVLTAAQRRALATGAPAASLTAGAGSGPAVAIDHAEFNDPVDVDLLIQKASFAQMAGSL